MTIHPWQRQYNSTVQLHKILNGSFSLDALDIADAYVEDTRLDLFIYNWLKTQRQLAVKQHTPPHFEVIKQDFKDHLTRRISALQLCFPQVKERDTSFLVGKLDTDLWRELIQKEQLSILEAERPTIKSLLEASLHVQDMLFNCEEAIRYFSAETSQLAAKMKIFIETPLPAYLKLLPKLSEAKKGEILDHFAQFKAAIDQNDLESAKIKLAVIRKDIGPFVGGTV